MSESNETSRDETATSHSYAQSAEYELASTSVVHVTAPLMERVMYAGRYYLGGRMGVGIGVKRRPTRLQRYLMGRLLGIAWADEPHEVQEWHG